MSNENLTIKIVSSQGDVRTINLEPGGKISVSAGDRIILFGPDAAKAQLVRDGGDLVLMVDGRPYFTLDGYYEVEGAEFITDPDVAATYLTGDEGGLPLLTTPPNENAGPAPAETDTPQVDLVRATNPELPGDNAAAKAWRSDDDIQLDSAGYSAGSFSYGVEDEQAPQPAAPAPAEAPVEEEVNLPPYFTTVTVTTDADGNITALEANAREAVEEYSFQQYEYVWPYQDLLPGPHPTDQTGDGAGGVPTYFSRYIQNDLSESSQQGGSVTGWGFSPNSLLGYIGVADPENDPLTVQWENGQATITDPSGTAIYQVSVSFASDITLTTGESSLILVTVLDANGDPLYDNVHAVMSFIFDPNAPGFWAAYYDYDGEDGIAAMFGLTDQFTTFISVDDAYHGPVQVPVNLEILDVNEAPLFTQDYYELNPHETGPPETVTERATTEAADGPDPLSDPPEGYGFYVGNVHADDPDWLDQAQYGGQVIYQFALDAEADGGVDPDGNLYLDYVGDEGDTLGWRPELMSQLNADGRLWIDPETGDIFAADDAWDLVSHTFDLSLDELYGLGPGSIVLFDGDTTIKAIATDTGGTRGTIAFGPDLSGLHVEAGFENGNDGIDADDLLTINFDNPVLLTSMDLSDFFVGTNAEDMEWGRYTLVSAATGTEVDVYFESNSIDGDYTYLFEHTGYVSSISFQGAWLDEGVTSDYILDALSFQEKPDDIDTAYVIAHDGRDRDQDIYDQDGNLVYDADRIYSDAWDAAGVDVASPEAPDDKAVLNDQHHYVYEGNMSPSFWLGDTVDLDGQTVTYTITGGNEDGIWAVYIGSDGMAYLGAAGSSAYALDYETLPNQYNLTVEVTDGDYVDDATITVDVFNVDPYFNYTGYYTLIDEGTDGSSTSYGYIARFSANDPLTSSYGGDLIYGLANDYDGLFQIDQSTGEVLATRALDYETDQHSYSLTIWVSDNSEGTNEYDDTYSFTFDINNLAPDLTFDPASTITVDEGATGDLYTALGTDPGNPDAEPDDDTLVYSITGVEYDDGGTWTDGSAYSGYFSIDAQTGQVVQTQALDYETQPTSFRINIEVSDDGQGTGGLTDSDYLYVNVANVGPSIEDIADININEMENGDKLVGQAKGSDPMNSAVDPNMYYWLENDYSGKFTIDNSTGEIRAVGDFDYETEAHSYDLTVLVSDTGGQSTDTDHVASTDFTVNIDNVEARWSSVYTWNPIPEGTDGSVNPINLDYIVLLDGYDPATEAHDGTLYYGLVDDHDGLFAIDSVTGKVLATRNLDYETDQHSYYLTLYVSDNSTGLYEVDRSINATVYLQNEAPSMDAPTLASLDEGETGVIGTAVATDPGNPATEPDDEALVYSITGVYYLDGGGDKVYGQYDDFFQINQQTGEIILDQALDYENDPTELYLDIQASDNGLGTGGLTTTVTSKFTQTNVAPTLESIADVHVDEQDDGEVFIADASATDPLTASDGPPLAYSLANDYGGVFTINADTGEISAHGALDFENTYSYDLEVMVSDGTDSDSQTFTVYIDDVDAEIHGVEMLNQGAMEGESGMAIAQVDASDPGGGYLNYVLEGQDYGAFKIDDNGQVSLYAPVDYEHGPYELTVGVFTIGGGVNDDEITFYYTPVNVDPTLTLDYHDDTLTEGTYVSEQIASVTAYDPETDAFGGDLYYDLANTYGGLFGIDHRTGLVTANGDFDFESLSPDDLTYSLTITVSDNSSGSYEVDASVQFDITITNQDGALSVHTATDSIAEGTHDHLLLGNAWGWDPLNNPYGDGLSYQLADDFGGRFEIDQSDGNIYFTGSFNYEALPEDQREITIQVQLVDGSGVCDTKDITFDIDNVAPHMDHIDQSVYSINEGNFSGQIAQAFGADPLDSAHGGNLTYSLDDDFGGRFSIDSSSGVISANGTFDYETTPSYSLEVIVSDGTTSNSETIEVDIANRAPAFYQVAYWDFLDEGEYSDYRVADFDASDPAGGDLTYSLVDDYGGLLTINSATGEVFITGAIDYENGPQTYYLNVEASDGELTGNWFINDKSFVVHNVAVAADHLDTLAASADEGYFSGDIAQAFGDDPVNDPHDGTLTYSLANTYGGLFSIDGQTGVVSAHGEFDYETTPSYHLVVEVSDGPTSDTFSFDFDIDNVAVEMSGFTYSEMHLMEGEFTDEHLQTASGMDPLNDAHDGSLSYSLADTFGDLFYIDSTSGEVFINGEADYETGSGPYRLEVLVTDGASTDSDYFDVFIDNVAVRMDHVTQTVHGFDEGYFDGEIARAFGDDPANGAHDGALAYSLDSDSGGLFSIDSTTGVISASGTFNYETAPSYTLEVIVSDGETSDSQTIEVDITNLAPHMYEVTYYDTFDEGEYTNARVATFGAEDPAGGDLSYSLVDDHGGLFHIDSVTGVVYITGALDYETGPHTYSLNATASDGELSDSFFMPIEINVRNERVYADRLDTLASSTDEGYYSGDIAQAFGKDPVNDPHDGTLTYSLVDDFGGLFSIDGQTGVVSAHGEFDYETTPSYHLVVEVSDGPTSDTFSFDFNIDNVAVVMDHITQSVDEIYEGSFSGEIGQAFGADPLDDPHDGTLTYSLANTRGGLFSINAATGVISAHGDFDYETAPSYSLDVTVSHGGTSDTETIEVDIVNQAPRYTQIWYLNGLNEGEYTNHLVADFDFIDPAGGDITYSLVNDYGGLLTIDSSTGEVFLTGTVDFESDPAKYRFEVLASDGELSGQWYPPPHLDMVIKNLAPVFTGATQTADIAEGSYTNYLVADYDAEDPAGGDITFSLVDDFGGLFSIDAATGQVFINGDIDYETGPAQYTLTIVASDGILNTTYEINNVFHIQNVLPEVMVDADGDQIADASTLVTEGYTGFIGAAIGNDPANPASEPNDDNLTYAIAGVTYYDSASGLWVDDGAYDGYLSIDNQTGEITLNQAVDYDSGHTALKLTITAQDTTGAGNPTEFIVNIADDPYDNLTGTAFMGDFDNAAAGYSTAGLGQYNGLGAGDFVIGAPGGEGTVYVVYGDTSWTAGDKSTMPNMTHLSPGMFHGMVIHGQSAGDHAGWAVAGPGDLNNDGKADLIIGAIGADTSYQPDDVWTPSSQALSFASASRTDTGDNYVLNNFMWNTTGTSMVNVTVSGIEGWWASEVTWNNSAKSFGINGMDGQDDEVDGRGWYDEHLIFTFSEAVHLSGFTLANVDSNDGGYALLHVVGSSDPVRVNIADGQSNVTFALTAVTQIEFYTDGRNQDDYSVAGFYGGGTFVEQDPVVVHDVGAAYVVFGSSAMAGSQLDLGDNLGNNGFKIIGEEAGGHLGWAVSGAGRFNGDAYSDIVVSAPHAASDAGSVYFIWGQASAGAYGDVIDVAGLGSDGFKAAGAAAGDLAGWSLDFTDLDGNGVSEVLIGAPGNGSGDAGAAYVLMGDAAYYNNQANQGKDLDDIVADGKATKIVGEDNGDSAGWDVSDAGDINGDGIDDIIIGAPEADGGAGAAYVIFGGTVLANAGATIDLESLDGSNGFKITGNAGDELGYSVSGAGDVNDDGIDDIIVGSPGADNDTGEAVVIFGDDGSDGSTAWDDGVIDVDDILTDPETGVILEGEDQGDRAGEEVSGAGDVNDDGVDDVVVSAPEADGQAGGGDEGGEAYLILGSSDLTSCTEVEISEVVDQAA